MKRIALITIAALICSAGYAENELLAEKIRAGYCGVATPVEHAQELADNGFNAVWAKMNFDGNYDAENSAWGEACRDAGIGYFIVANTTGGAERALEGYRRAVDENGLPLEIACLRDETFLDVVFRDRALAMLDAADEGGYALAGFILDVETYGIKGNYHHLTCFCDTCWADYLAEEGIADAGEVTPAGRMMWLVRNQRYPAYVGWQAAAWEATFARIAAELRERQPHLLLGNFHYMDTAFHRALLRGVGTEDAPALVGWESPSYTGGLIDGAKQALYYEAIGAHAVDVGGQWIGRLMPDAAAAHAYQTAMNTAGYWLFNSSSLRSNWQETEPNSPYYLPRPAEEYWAAYALANAEIDRSLADAEYESPLNVDLGSKLAMPAVPSSPEAIEKSLALDRDAVPLHPEATDPPEVEAPWVRCAGMALIWAEAGQTISGRVETKQIGSYAMNGTWALLGPSGVELASNMVRLGESEDLAVPATETGVHTLFLQVGKNAIRADMQMPHAVLRDYLDGSVWFVYAPPPLYFFVPAEAQKFTLSIKPGGGQEGCDLRVFNADGDEVLEAIEASGLYEFEPPADQRGRAWRMELTDTPNLVFEDVNVHLEGCPPYFALSPEALLVPPASAAE